MYENSVAKSVKVFQLKKEQGWSEEEFDLATRFVQFLVILSIFVTEFNTIPNDIGCLF